MKNNKIVTKKDLIEKVATKLDVSLVESKKLCNTLFDTLVDEIKTKKDIRISGLGVFSMVLRKERMAINLQTKEKIKIPEKNALKFKVSKKLKEQIEQIK